MSGKSSDVEQIARVLGMRTDEVVDVQLDAEGVLAQTHDGNWTLIRDGGVLEFLGQDLGERAADAAEEPKPVAPKGRGRA